MVARVPSVMDDHGFLINCLPTTFSSPLAVTQPARLSAAVFCSVSRLSQPSLATLAGSGATLSVATCARVDCAGALFVALFSISFASFGVRLWSGPYWSFNAVSLASLMSGISLAAAALVSMAPTVFSNGSWLAGFGLAANL